MDQHTRGRSPQERLDFKTEMTRRRQFEESVPLAFITIGQLMLERGLKIRSGIDANKYDRRVQVTVSPEDVEAWEACGEVVNSTCSMVRSPFGPTSDQHYTRIETAVRVGLVEFDVVSYHDVPVDANVTPLAVVGGSR